MQSRESEQTMSIASIAKIAIRAIRSTILACVFLGTAAYAETILMRNGETYRGRIVVYDTKEVTIRLDDGTVKKFAKTSILRVKHETLSDADAANVRAEEEKRARALEKLEEEKKVANEKRKKEIEELIAWEQKTRAALDAETARLIEDRINEMRRGGWKALWRSAVLPGWGQSIQGHDTKAAVVFVNVEAALIHAVTSYDRYLTARRHYDSNPSALVFLVGWAGSNQPLLASSLFMEERARSAVRREARMATSAWGLFVTVYGLNLIDAFFFNASTDPLAADRGMRPQIQYAAFPEPGGRTTHYMSVRFSF